MVALLGTFLTLDWSSFWMRTAIVHPRFMPYEIVKRYGKEAGGPWDYYDADSFTGWEADRVLAIISSGSTSKIVEILTHLPQTRSVSS